MGRNEKVEGRIESEEAELRIRSVLEREHRDASESLGAPRIMMAQRYLLEARSSTALATSGNQPPCGKVDLLVR